jgi:hypothetical protein
VGNCGGLGDTHAPIAQRASAGVPKNRTVAASIVAQRGAGMKQPSARVGLPNFDCVGLPSAIAEPSIGSGLAALVMFPHVGAELR